MDKNSYKYQKRTKSSIVVIIIAVVIYLLSMTSYDAFVSTPHKKARIDTIHNKFMDMKSYLDVKLPQMDTALIQHEQQIREQNEQLEELNKLTEVLREE